MTVQVFDKPMCCSTGICGPEVDPNLVRFAADLDWLKRQGVQVVRYNLSQQPREFAEQAEVRTLLQTKDVEVLPVILVEGHVVCQGMYPSRDLLASWAHVEPRPEALLPVTASGCCQPGSGCC